MILPAFILVVALAFWALATLGKPEDCWYFLSGVILLTLAWIMRLFKVYDIDTRLLGYGLLLVLLGLKPPKLQARLPWLTYAGISIIFGITNSAIAPDLGANEPQYVRLAAAFEGFQASEAKIFSNSFHVLDVHALLPTIPVHSGAEVDPNGLLLMIDGLPQSAVSTPVWPIQDFDFPNWCVLKEVNGAKLYKRCLE